MCGVKDTLVNRSNIPSINCTIKRELSGSRDLRREKSRDAARHRRSKESDYFQELAELLPVQGTPPNSQMISIDKTSLIRLSVAYLKTRDLIQQSDTLIVDIKDEAEINIEETLNGFSLVLNQDHDIVHVSNNVNEYIGLTSFELVGMQLYEFVHPCDHSVVRELVPPLNVGQERHVKVYMRIKCTITERGRLINLKQAHYKSVRVEGKAKRLKENEGKGGLSGVVFMGICNMISTDMSLDTGLGVFETKHSTSFKFMELDKWLTDTAGYDGAKLLDYSLLELVHAQDAETVQSAFAKLGEHGHCETEAWRLLVAGGGHVYIQTRAVFVSPRKGSNKSITIHCKHSILTEVLKSGVIESLLQLQCKTDEKTTTEDNKTQKDTLKTQDRSKELDQNENRIHPVAAEQAAVTSFFLNPDQALRNATSPIAVPSIEGATMNKLVGSLLSAELEKVSPMICDETFENVMSSNADDSGADLEKMSPLICDKSIEEVISLNAVADFNKLVDPLLRTEMNKTSPFIGEETPSDDSNTEYEAHINNMCGSLLSTELEKLSPFIGDETIPLNNEDFEGFYTLGFENFHDLEFPDEIFNFCANTEQLFQQDSGSIALGSSNSFKANTAFSTKPEGVGTSDVPLGTRSSVTARRSHYSESLTKGNKHSSGIKSEFAPSQTLGIEREGCLPNLTLSSPPMFTFETENRMPKYPRNTQLPRYTSTDTLEKSGKQRDGEQDGEFKKQSVLWELLTGSGIEYERTPDIHDIPSQTSSNLGQLPAQTFLPLFESSVTHRKKGVTTSDQLLQAPGTKRRSYECSLKANKAPKLALQLEGGIAILRK